MTIIAAPPQESVADDEESSPPAHGPWDGNGHAPDGAPSWLLAGVEHDAVTEPHICRGID